MNILTTVSNADRPICLSFLVLLMFSYVGLGQPSPNSMRVSGVVTDFNGAAVAGAKVTLKDPATNKEVSTTTDAQGFYRFSNVGPGKCQITVEAAGFPNEVINGVEVKASQNKTVDIKMPVRQSSTGSGTQAPGSQQHVGNIGGQVMDRQNVDGTRSLLTDFKSEVPIDTVKIPIRGPLGEKIEIAHAPPGWVSSYDQKTGNLVLTRGPEGLPLFEIQARYNVPKPWAAQLEEFFKKGKSVEFDFSLGPFNYGPRDFQVTLAPPIKVVTPDQALTTPETARVGETISATLNDGYKEDSLRVRVGEESYDAYGEIPSQSELSKWVTNYLQGIGSPHEREYLERVRKAVEENTAPKPGQEPPLGEYRIVWDLPANTPLNANIHVTGTNKFGEKTFDGPVNMTLLPPLSPAYSLIAPRLFDCTPKLFQGDKLCVCGFFPNVFSRQQLLLDGKPLNHPRSGSTDTLIFVLQNLAPGKHVITWDVPAFDGFYNPEPRRGKPSATERLEFIVLEVKGEIDRDKLRSGERTEMHLRIIGTDEKLPIELTNNTPDVIELEGKTKQIIITSGGSNNTLTRWVKAQKTGRPIANFDIQYRLTVPPCPCKPEMLSEFLSLAGVLPKTPKNPPGDLPLENPEDCELIMLEYTKLSIEYGKQQADLKRALEACNNLDDGTVLGRDFRDQCKAFVTGAFELGIGVDMSAGLNEMRKRLLDLLSRYRACREGKPAAAGQ